MAGVSRLQYTTEARLIRVMCSGRVDPEFVVRAFLNGMDGVFIAGCRLNECNYVTHGNFHALNMVLLFRKVMERIGLDPRRLQIGFMSSGEGNLFTAFVNRFVGEIRDLGPAGAGEGNDGNLLKFKLKCVEKLVPYLRLVQSEKFTVKLKSEQEHVDYFNSDVIEDLFDRMIGSSLAAGEVVSLLSEGPLSAGDISKALGFSPSETSRLLNRSSRLGLVRYDEGRKVFAPA